MKRFFRLLPLLLLLSAAPTMHSQAQLFDAIRAAIIAAIKAADIAVQKVQNVTIGLQNAQKVLENQLTQLNLGVIGDWEAKTKDLYEGYFDELKKVKTAISYFKEVTAIIQQQHQLVSEYKTAYSLIQQDRHFSPEEVAYMYKVYTGIIGESVNALDEIISVLRDFSLQMSDAARLAIIREASRDIEQLTTDLRRFNNQAAQVSLQRAKNEADTRTILQLYGLSP